MSNLTNHDAIVPQDLGLDDVDVNDLGLIEALSQDEIDELMNSDVLPASERLSRLVEIREHLSARVASEVGDNDAASLLGEVERGIATLQTQLNAVDERTEAGFDELEAAIDIDPLEHRETLAPDDDALLDMADGDDDDDPDEDEEEDDEEDDDLDDDDGQDDLDDEDDKEDADDGPLQARSAPRSDLDEVLDPPEWEQDGDGFDTDKGVR